MAVQKQDRDLTLDMAKGILIILVVFAHTIESITIDTNYVAIIHAAIYSFHMPAFIFISGFLSRNDEKAYWNSITSCLIPFLVLNIAYSILKKNLNILMPGPALWYFLCLFYWRIGTGALKRIKYLMPISFVLALFVGFISNVDSFLGISRAICFYPFFLLGYFCTEREMAKIKSIPKWISTVAFISVLAISIMLRLFVFKDLSYALKDPYDISSKYTIISDLMKRSVLLVLFFIGTISFLSLTSIVKRENQLCVLGKRTVSIYALHIFIVHGVFLISRKILHSDPANLNWGGVIALSIGMTAAVVFTLGNKYIFNLYNKIMNKILKAIVSD